MYNKHVCKYCGREFETGAKLGGHIIGCSQNPRKKEILEKTLSKKREASIKKYNIHKRVLTCEVCGKEYELELSEKMFSEGKYRRTCSSQCSHKLTCNKTDFNIKNSNISSSLIKYYEEHEFPQGFGNNCTVRTKKAKSNRYCEECGLLIDDSLRPRSRFCSDECRERHRSKAISKSVTGKTGGYRFLSGRREFKKGRYNNIYFDSSWELAYYIYCIEHNINIERCKEIRYYIYNEKQYKYYPDFIVNGEIIEIKGYITDKVKYKIEQNPDIKVLYYKDIEHCILYCKEKYGDKFWESLYANE